MKVQNETVKSNNIMALIFDQVVANEVLFAELIEHRLYIFISLDGSGSLK
jgi:hypothetical protein